MKITNIKRGDVFWVSFDPSQATEIQKTRPAIVLSHDLINENSSRIIVAPITSNVKKVYSFEYEILSKDVQGKVMIDQIRSIDKVRLKKRICSLSIKEMNELEPIIKFVLGLK